MKIIIVQAIPILHKRMYEATFFTANTVGWFNRNFIFLNWNFCYYYFLFIFKKEKKKKKGNLDTL